MTTKGTNQRAGFKRERLGPRLVAAARSGERYRDAHVFLGGTGAVGGTALLQMLSMYEEMFSINPPAPDDAPVLIATGTSEEEIAAFTRRLFRFVESRHGPDRRPAAVRGGYVTPTGVLVRLERFEVAVFNILRVVGRAPPEKRPTIVARFLAEIGTRPDDPAEIVFKALATAINQIRPFSDFLRSNLRRHHIQSFRSVLIGIPISSLVAYHDDDAMKAAGHVSGFGPQYVADLKDVFVEAIRDDLLEVRDTLADTVLVAHTTGVGGMEDERLEGGPPEIRLGFAHSAQDRALAEKAKFAERLTDLYAAAGIKVLITAAAIGIDDVRAHQPIPLHREIRRRLLDAPGEVFPGSKEVRPAELEGGEAGPPPHVLRVFPPLTVPFDDPGAGPVAFDRGGPIVPSYAIRSGENGFMTVANADALYRVMRVASVSELGLMLASVGLLGDDRLSPWFSENVCYYSETDNSRQVFDFLSQRDVRAAQLSGLEPMALQDLGSAKHQGELHTLALLILLHRLRTVHARAIPSSFDLDAFDPRAFLLEHSRPLTFEDVTGWEFDALARDLAILAGAERPEDLAPLVPRLEHGPSAAQQEVLRRVLDEVLRGVWTVTSLGSPILFERGGRTFLRCGYYVAPLDLLVTDRGAVSEWLRQAHIRSGNPCPYRDYRDYHVAVGGFVDLRRDAVVCTGKSDEDDLTGRVSRFGDVDALRRHLWSLEPYSFFATCGLLAVWFRLRALHGLLAESTVELGSVPEWRWHVPRDAQGRALVVPGVVEALRMVSEGLEKTTGTERLDGMWGYERRPLPDRTHRVGRASPHA